MAKTIKTEEWAYEYQAPGEKKAWWIPEDDKHSAEYKALYRSGATGRIRSRKVKTTTTKWKVEGL